MNCRKRQEQRVGLTDKTNWQQTNREHKYKYTGGNGEDGQHLDWGGDEHKDWWNRSGCNTGFLLDHTALGVVVVPLLRVHRQWRPHLEDPVVVGEGLSILHILMDILFSSHPHHHHSSGVETCSMTCHNWRGGGLLEDRHWAREMGVERKDGRERRVG